MHNTDNPWVGLRAYTEGEVLYGRDKDILALTTYVLAEKEVVLYGKSGTGKSSILNAGVIPSARRAGFTPITIRLEHKADSKQYIDQIVNAIKKADIKIQNVVPYANPDEPLLWEVFHCNRFETPDGSQAKLLLIFDQFEEVFTLQEENRVRNDFFKEVADLLNDIKPRQLCDDDVDPQLSKSEPAPTASADDDIFAQIDLLSLNSFSETSAYVNNDVHLVFSLREDYLSDFEFYTRKIPALKQHRYAFRPIDESQAVEIIMKPRKGLVSEEVAELIISKINKSDDGENQTGTGLETVILSLFLSELYHRLPAGATAITKEMLDKFGNDIIKDFYLSVMSNEEKISPRAVKYIENLLLTKDGHRDNKDIEDVLDKDQGLNRRELAYLEDEKRILSRFTRSKTTRFEFIHDIIAEQASKHRHAREAEAQAKALQERKIAEAKKKQWISIGICSVLLALSIGAILWLLNRDNKVLPTKQSFMITFAEDSLTSENEYWKGDFSVVGHRYNAPDTLLFARIIDKGLRDSVFRLEIDTLNSVTFLMKFPSYSKYHDIEINKSYSDLIQALNVKMQLHKKQPKAYPYYGRVIVDTEGISWPVQNALVCLHDITTRTDSVGNFKFYLENEISDDDDIYIIKKGFASMDFKVSDNKVGDLHTFALQPKDSIQSVRYKIAEIDSLMSISKITYSINNQIIYPSDGSTDVLNLRAAYLKTIGDKFQIKGYFYLSSLKNQSSETSDLLSYYFFVGEIDKRWVDGFKNYTVDGKNYIGNELSISGTYKQNAGTWTGELSSPVGFNAVFPKP